MEIAAGRREISGEKPTQGQNENRNSNGKSD